MRNAERKQHIRDCREFTRGLLTLPEYDEKSLDIKLCAEAQCIDMDKPEYERFKQEIQSRYEQEIAQAKERCDKAMASIENVWAIAQGMQPSSGGTAALLTWPQMVEQILPKLKEPFTRIDAENAVRGTFKDAKLRKNSLGGVMTRLCQRQIIEPVEAGKGPILTTYRMKKKP